MTKPINDLLLMNALNPFDSEVSGRLGVVLLSVWVITI